MNRRAFLSRFVKGAAATAAVALAIPDELFTPEPIRTYFLPPADGWKNDRTVNWGKWKNNPSRISMRMVKEFDVQSDVFPCRMDVIMGYSVIRPEYAGMIRCDDGDGAVDWDSPEMKQATSEAGKRLAAEIDRRCMEEYLKPAMKALIDREDRALMALAQQSYPSPSLQFHKDAFSLVMP